MEEESTLHGLYYLKMSKHDHSTNLFHGLGSAMVPPPLADYLWAPWPLDTWSKCMSRFDLVEWWHFGWF